MVDIGKQVIHWRDGAEEDWAVGCELLETGRIRHALFFAHLAMEKLLKAVVCKETQALAPRSHNLVRLAELAGLTLSSQQLDVLAEMNAFNIEGRYPDTLPPPPSAAEARGYVDRAEEVRQWLIQQL